MCCLVATANGAPIDDARAAYKSRDYKLALKLYRPLAEQGAAEAQYKLGYMYHMYHAGEVQGFSQNYQEALKWFRLAAAQGNAEAQFYIGWIYAHGERTGFAVTQNDKEAVRWYRLAAAQGNADAQVHLGVMYSDGRGVAQDDAEAMKWYRLAAAQGNADAKLQLTNKGTIKDADEAYYRGNYKLALKLYRPLAEQGLAEAQYNFGDMYRIGQGVTENPQEALKWFRLAGTQGLEKAQLMLGMRLIDGEDGFPHDPLEALKWFRLSAAQGNKTAIAMLNTREMDAAALLSNDGRNKLQKKEKWVQVPKERVWEEVPLKKTAGQTPPDDRVWTPVPAKRQAEQATAARKLEDSKISANSKWQPVDDKGWEDVPKKDETKSVSVDEPQLKRKVKLSDVRKQSQEIASPPKLVFKSSAPNADGTVELSGRVTSDANISDISINGRSLEVPLASNGSFKVTRLPPMGVVTTYRLSVADEYGQKAEKEINVERAAIQYAEQVAPLNPRKLKAQANPNAVALIIGVESYLSLPQAKYADSDATHFYDYASQSLGVPPNKIKLLTDSKASRLELLKAMRSWMKTEVVSGKSDVYIFFAGHGLASPDGSKTYLLPADGDRDLLDETSILRDDLIASAKGAKTITLFLDTCYSGGTRTNEILLADARPIAIVPDKSALPSNVTVLAAASGAQLSSTYEAAQQGLEHDLRRRCKHPTSH